MPDKPRTGRYKPTVMPRALATYGKQRTAAAATRTEKRSMAREYGKRVGAMLPKPRPSVYTKGKK
jgi:hypothetical protein